MINLSSDSYKYDYQIEILKQTDKNIINNILSLNNDTEFKVKSVSIRPKLGSAFGINIDILDKTTKSYLERESEIIREFVVDVNINGAVLKFKIERDVYEKGASKRSNKDMIYFDCNIDETNQDVIMNFNLLYSELRKLFKAVYSEKVLKESLSENLNNIYKVREAELIKLESIAKDLVVNQSEYMKEKDIELLTFKKEIQEKYDNEKKVLQEEYDSKQKLIKEKELAFEEKQKLIDDRSSKHARREIRKNLKEEFKSRNENFNLTKGTVSKRKVIHVFSIILLIVFGLGFIMYSGISIYDLLYDKTENILSLSIKNIVFALTFGSTSVFYIRWNNKWFEQHANEEFKMKQYEIDLERASWLVEMALEWQSECKGEIPSELIERLSQNLFQINSDKQTELHPSDQLASLLFGAASSLNIKTPIGADLTLDRKSINKLKQKL